MDVILQLDLARQKETPETLAEAIDFAAANGYTALLLYLEGGVRTASFAFADPERSYAPEEMARVVKQAAARGLKVIPALNTLGHCELFLRHPQLAGLSEQRELPETEERHELCPSDPEVAKFLERYLTEIAAIFPAPELHVGCDEVFRLASCPRCRARLAAGESRAEIFAAHLQLLHRICRKLGKRMVIWDDMADFFPELLELLPAEIVRVFWEYNELVETKETKYGNRRRIDILGHYERTGTPFWGAPREFLLSNIQSLSRYALSHHPEAMLLTVWEHANDFLYSYWPQAAFAGRWWRSGGRRDPEETFAEAVRELFGTDDPVLSKAVRAYADCPPPAPVLQRGGDPAQSGFRKAPDPLTGRELAELRLIREVFVQCAPKITTELGKKVMTDLLLRSEYELLELESGLWLNRLFREETEPDSSALAAGWEHNRSERERLWRRFRPGLDDTALRRWAARPLANLERCRTLRRQSGGLLELRLLLPDHYGREELKVELAAGDDRYETVFLGTPKPENRGDWPFYTFYAPVPPTLAQPEKIRLTARGDNGVGLVWAGVRSYGGGVRQPVALLRRDGLCEHPEALLTDDTTWAMLGNRDGHRSLWDQELHNRNHQLEYQLA